MTKFLLKTQETLISQIKVIMNQTIKSENEK